MDCRNWDCRQCSKYLLKRLWYVDIHGDNRVNYNKYSLLLEPQTIRKTKRAQCTSMDTHFIVGSPELVTAVVMSRLPRSRLVIVGP
jgi:hypothetical protein